MVSVVLYQRLFLFVVGPILIGYAIILSRTILTSEIRFLPVMVLLAIGGVAIARAHQDRLTQYHAWHQVIYAQTSDGTLLITDDETNKLVPAGVVGRRETLNTDEIGSLTELFDRIESADTRDVFLISLTNDEGVRSEHAERILAHYPFVPVVQGLDERSLEIFRLGLPGR